MDPSPALSSNRSPCPPYPTVQSTKVFDLSVTSQAVISLRKTETCLDLFDIFLSPLISTFPHLEAEYTPVELLVNSKFMDLDDRECLRKFALFFREDGHFGGYSSRGHTPCSFKFPRPEEPCPSIQEIPRYRFANHVLTRPHNDLGG